MVAWGADVGQLLMVWGPMVNHRLIVFDRVPEDVTDPHKYPPPQLQFVSQL